VVGASRRNPGAIRALLATLLAIAVASPLVTRASEPDVPAESEGLGAFARVDGTGTRLDILATVERPERLTTAFCRGQHVHVRFDGDRRFTVASGSVGDASACFLASDSFAEGRTLLPISSPTGTGACAARAKWAWLRNRYVDRCWPLARLGARTKRIALVQFEPVGRDALASLVFSDGDRATFADYPADEGGLSADAFEIVFVLQRGAWTALGVSWSRADGAALAVSISERGEPFQEVVSDYWSAP
jgi:hypothetical protein